MIELNVWSPTLEWRASLSDYTTAELILRHNAIGQATIKLPAVTRDGAPNPRVKHLIARGARLTADLATPTGKRRIFSGRLTEYTGEGLTSDAGWEAVFESDLALLWGMVAIPDPTHPLSDQSAQQYDVQSGTVEAAFKAYVSRNAGRFNTTGLPPITVAPNLNRGGTLANPIQARMQPVGDLLTKLADDAGLGLWVVQTDTGLLVDVYQTRNHPYNLSELNGTVTGWKVTGAAPTATRVFVAGSGTSTARSFLEAAPVFDQQQAWGRRIEVYEEGGSTQTEMAKAAETRLNDAAPKWGVSVSVADGPTFDFGQNVWLGDRVTIELSQLDKTTEVLRELKLSSDMGIGPDGFPAWSTNPTVGEISNGSTTLFKTITRLAEARKGRA